MQNSDGYFVYIMIWFYGCFILHFVTRWCKAIEVKNPRWPPTAHSSEAIDLETYEIPTSKMIKNN